MTSPTAITLAIEILREDMRALVECHAHPDTGVIPPDEPEARAAFDRYCAAINGLEALAAPVEKAAPSTYSEWSDFYAGRITEWLTLDGLRAEVAKLATVDAPSPERLLIHAMHLLEAQQAAQPELVTECVFSGPAPDGYADWPEWVGARAKRGAYIRAARAEDFMPQAAQPVACGLMPLTDEQADAAVHAWFGRDADGIPVDAGPGFRKRMRAAFAAVGIKAGKDGAA